MIISGNVIDVIIAKFFIPVFKILSGDLYDIDILKNITFFCYGGAILIEFDEENFDNLKQKIRLSSNTIDKIIEDYFFIKINGNVSFRRRFINEQVINHSNIVISDLTKINKILDDCIRKFAKFNSVKRPMIDNRFVQIENEKYNLQITLKPISDRDQMVKIIKDSLSDYPEIIVQIAGRTSIDLSKKNKKTALEWYVINKLNLKGKSKEEIAKRVIYIGDSFDIKGNDFCMAQALNHSILNFAVNKNKVAIKSNIVICKYSGIEATNFILFYLLEVLEDSLYKYSECLEQNRNFGKKSVIEMFKSRFLQENMFYQTNISLSETQLLKGGEIILNAKFNDL